jgi:hypothetical protein
LAGLPTGEIKPGDTFDVTVDVSNAKAVQTYEVHLAYDTSKLAVENLVSNGSLFQAYTANMAGAPTRDGMGLVNSILGKTLYGASGEGTLATVRFRAIGRATDTYLKLTDATLIGVDATVAKPKLDGNAQIVLSNAPMVYHDASGKDIHGLILSDVDNKVDFNDFVTLTQAFGTSAGSSRFDIRADLNGDNQVNFADFLIFSNDFNKVAVDAPTAQRAGKTAPAAAGVNTGAEIGLKVDGAAKIGKDLVVNVEVSKASALSGWGLTLGFDPQQYEFVKATAPDGNLLSQAGASTPVFLVHQDGSGKVSLANAIAGDGSASGDGVLASLVFRPKGEFDDAQFQVFGGALFDANQLQNPAVSSVLDVRPVPAEFALDQNYPNPFNPETTITYDLAAGSQVQLEIYNVMGQVVRTLVSEHQAAGRYRINWTGQDAAGRQVASGIYFYRLQAGDFHAVKKLMLLK